MASPGVAMPEKFCLQWNEFKDNINTAFGNLRGDSDFTDVTLVCEDGQKVKAHKVILAMSSPFFLSLFKSNQHPHPLIFMRGLMWEDLVAIVDFLYCGEANLLQENVDSFLAIAEELQLRGLVEPNGEQSNSELRKKKIIAPRERKSTFKKEKLMPDPVKSKFSGQTPTIKVEKLDKTVALTSSVSGLDLEELAETVKSFMGKTEKRTQNGMGFLYICKVCGKEGQSHDIQNHIEANHLEGDLIPCNMCDKTARTRGALANHKSRYHRNTVI